MLFLYIGAGIIALLLIIFVVVSVIIVARRVTTSVNAKASALLSQYDTLIEEKSQILDKLNQEILEVQKAAALPEVCAVPAERSEEAEENRAITVLNAAERISSSKYMEQETAELYRKIRENFDHSPVEVIRQLVSELGEKGPATELLEQLDYQTIYDLSMLSEEQQLRILEESLDENGRKLLMEYCSLHSRFQAIGFYDFIKSREQNESHSIRLWIAPTASQRYYPNGVEVFVDDDICEGFQIELNNKIYDYCVRKREIS